MGKGNVVCRTGGVPLISNMADICTLDFLDDEGIKELIMPFAQKSHRAQDLGIRDKK